MGAIPIPLPASARRVDHERVARDRRRFQRYAATGRPGMDRDALVQRFLPLARRLAARYTRGGEPFDDVFQVACIGLVKAVDRYDPTRGMAFSSYAVPTIVGEIKRYYRDKTWAVHVPRDLLELALRVDRAADDMVAELGRSPTVGELAGRLDMSEEDVLEAREAARARRATSMEQPRGAGDEDVATLGESIGIEERGFALAEHRATLASVTQCLSERDREIMRLRFAEDLTQDEIGAVMHISQMQVSRVLRASLARLQALGAASA
jgi:RNA polymerase sigma-B factor